MSLTSTNKSNFLVGAKALHGNPYDGHTLKEVLSQVYEITGVKPKEAQVDQGYKKHGIKDIEIIFSRQKRGVTPAKKKCQQRRNVSNEETPSSQLSDIAKTTEKSRPEIG